MKCRILCRRRQGVTTVEAAVVMSTVFLVLFVLFDLGLAAFRYNTLAASARRLGREAVVHGALAAPEKTVWGPVEYSGTANDSGEIPESTVPVLATMLKPSVNISVTWPDGNNRENDRVHVRLTYAHHPIIPFLSLSPLVLQAETTMYILH